MRGSEIPPSHHPAPCRHTCRGRAGSPLSPVAPRQVHSKRACRAEREVDMPENYTSLLIMVIVLVVVCGAVGLWALRSRRRHARVAPVGRRDRPHTTLEGGNRQ